MKRNAAASGAVVDGGRGKRARGEAVADARTVLVLPPAALTRRVARERRRIAARYHAEKPCVPVLRRKETDAARFRRVFGLVKCVHMPAFTEGFSPSVTPSQGGGGEPMSWRGLHGLFADLSDADKASWCIETPGDAAMATAPPGAFLEPIDANATARGYCSFLVQNDKAAMYQALARLPLPHLPYGEGTADAEAWRYGPSIWMFFGRNPEGSANLEGRGEHTDSVSHDGTWHYQLSGVKTWYLRPTGALIKKLRTSSDPRLARLTENTRLRVDCKAGDVLVVNTRLWWHRTVIPPQPTPSVSYARDFFVDGEAEAGVMDNSDGGFAMQNVEGHYATQDIDAGTILFTEDTMPDCGLHRSKTDANCEVVELDDGMGAVVSMRPIAAGEFFCVPESDDEEDDESSSMECVE